MIELNEFEKTIQDQLSLNDRDSRKMDRVLSDIEQIVGMSKIEILEFLVYGAKNEIEELNHNYNWLDFQKKLVKRLRAR